MWPLMCRSLLLVLLVILAGCAEASMVSSRVFGPPSIPAKYTLEKVPTLLLVENYRQGTQMQFDSESLLRELDEQMRKLELVPLVEIDKTYLLRDADPKAYRSMTIPEIGRKCGAEQVIYVDLRQLSIGLEEMSGEASGKCSVNLRVINAKNGFTLWPDGMQEGYPTSYSRKLTARSESYNTVRAKIIRGAADRICRNFYKYKPDEVPE